ncbi:PRC-barrel domain containing protein [Brevibacterium renqingii]|uniref:PRC-barrel domain containing protein n=1 Tax=Brevibacterium renqingii TaxID=2776916 RepID=UPI001AE09F91|nr:PRC-barrel domain containing protein [Brevibacterium renqingii]
MILSDLLDSRVCDSAGEPLGWVLDVRFTSSEERDRMSLDSLIVGPHRRTPFLGYERTGMDRPKLFAFVFRRMHAGSLVIPWQEVERIDANSVRLREDFASEPLVTVKGAKRR